MIIKMEEGVKFNKVLSGFVWIVSLWTVCQGQELSFLALADWGGLPAMPYRTAVESAVASQIGKVANHLGAQFLLALGDNFYYDGVKDVDDKRFKETFEDVFSSSVFDKKWYLVAGNHDHNGNVSAQIAYTKKSSRWTFPNYFYSLKFTVPNTKTSISIIMIDTIVLCGNTDTDFSGEPPIGPNNPKMATSQWNWIETQLRNNKADYVIVAGHFPVYSIAEHGPTKCLVEKLMPMLYKYKVSAYFSGHDHNLQHLVVKEANYNWTVNYFVIGCANFIDTSNKHKNKVPHDSSKFFWADKEELGGFAHIRASPQNLTFQFLTSKGKTLYKPVVLKPRKV